MQTHAISCPACDDDGGPCVLCNPSKKRHADYEFITGPCERALLCALGLAFGLSDSHSAGYAAGIGTGVWLVCWPMFSLLDRLRPRIARYTSRLAGRL